MVLQSVNAGSTRESARVSHPGDREGPKVYQTMGRIVRSPYLEYDPRYHQRPDLAAKSARDCRQSTRCQSQLGGRLHGSFVVSLSSARLEWSRDADQTSHP